MTMVPVTDPVPAAASGAGAATRRAGQPRGPMPWVVGLLVVLAAAAVVVVFVSPLLGVRSVEVVGAVGDTAVEVEQAAGILAGTPLARVDTDLVAARVLQLPMVRSVEVDRQWPNTVEISVTVREAVAVTRANDSWWLLDSAGDPYQRVTRPPEGLVPVQLATPGVDDPATRAAVSIVAQLPERVRADIVTVTARTPFDVTLELTDGRTVIWGSDEDTQAKLVVLPVILHEPGDVFDISDPALVTVE